MCKSRSTMQEKQTLPWKKELKEEERTARSRNVFRQNERMQPISTRIENGTCQN